MAAQARRHRGLLPDRRGQGRRLTSSGGLQNVRAQGARRAIAARQTAHGAEGCRRDLLSAWFPRDLCVCECDSGPGPRSAQGSHSAAARAGHVGGEPGRPPRRDGRLRRPPPVGEDGRPPKPAAFRHCHSARPALAEFGATFPTRVDRRRGKPAFGPSAHPAPRRDARPRHPDTPTRRSARPTRGLCLVVPRNPRPPRPVGGRGTGRDRAEHRRAHPAWLLPCEPVPAPVAALREAPHGFPDDRLRPMGHTAARRLPPKRLRRPP